MLPLGVAPHYDYYSLFNKVVEFVGLQCFLSIILYHDTLLS